MECDLQKGQFRKPDLVLLVELHWERLNDPVDVSVLVPDQGVLPGGKIRTAIVAGIIGEDCSPVFIFLVDDCHFGTGYSGPIFLQHFAENCARGRLRRRGPGMSQEKTNSESGDDLKSNGGRRKTDPHTRTCRSGLLNRATRLAAPRSETRAVPHDAARHSPGWWNAAQLGAGKSSGCTKRSSTENFSLFIVRNPMLPIGRVSSGSV